MIIITLSRPTSNSNAALRQEFRKLRFQMIDNKLGTATSTAPVDMRLESSGATAPDELDAAEEMPVVPTAVCAKPPPYGLNAAYFRQMSSGEPGAGKLHAGFCLGRREQEAMPTR